MDEYWDLRNEYQADMASEDRWNSIHSMDADEKIRELLDRGLIKEEEVDVPLAEFIYSDAELTDKLYDTDYSPVN